MLLITIILCNQTVKYYDTGEIREVRSYNEIRNKLEVVKVKRYYKNGQLKREIESVPTFKG